MYVYAYKNNKASFVLADLMQPASKKHFQVLTFIQASINKLTAISTEKVIMFILFFENKSVR